MDDDFMLLAANAAYYQAFAARDEEAMTSLWAEEDVSCVHPGWPPLLGRRAVLSSYVEIFRNPHQEQISHHGETCMLSKTEGRVICIESVGDATLVATNWFRFCDGRFLLVHHQAGPLAFSPQTNASRKLLH